MRLLWPATNNVRLNHSPNAKNLLEDGMLPHYKIRTLDVGKWNLPQVAFLMLGEILGHQSVANWCLHVKSKQSLLHFQDAVFEGHKVVYVILGVVDALLVQDFFRGIGETLANKQGSRNN